MTEQISIGTSSYIGIGIMIAGGIIIPLAVCIWWFLTKKEKITTVLTGAATWFVFAVILEGIPKSSFLIRPRLLGRLSWETSSSSRLSEHY